MLDGILFNQPLGGQYDPGSRQKRDSSGHEHKGENMHWYFDVLKKYAVFSGRSRRKEYWMFVLFNTVIGFALGFIDGAAGLVGEIGYGPLGGFYSLAVLVPSIAVSARRLHDTNRSGWWLLIAFVPLIGAIVLLVFMVRDSQTGDNQYGTNPKAAAA